MQTVIVSGAGGNLGSAITRKFLQEGFRVVGTVSKSHLPEGNESSLHLVPIDLFDEPAANNFIADTIRKFGCPKVAILTVGGFAFQKIAETTSDLMQSQYRLNFLTTYHLARPLFRAMVDNGGGRIYLTGASSAIDMQNSSGNAAYALSKSLLFRLNELLNLEGKEEDFQSSIIVPTIIDTPENRSSMPNANFSNWAKPDEIAEKVFDHFTNESKEVILEV